MMIKAVGKMQRKSSREASISKIKKELSELHSCYVLVTCGEPSPDGKMEVEMNYQGDESLAAFLLENAAQVFDEKMNPHCESK